MYVNDLESMTFLELRQLLTAVTRAIATFEDRQKAEARAKVDAIAKEMGYSLTDLVSRKPKATRAPAAPKYRHPENAALTWSGRGRMPLWFATALEVGKKPEDLAFA